MSTIVQRRRGTTAQHAAFTGALGETTFDTDLNRPVFHDGILAGGFPAAMLHLAQTFAQTQTLAAAENFFGSTANPINRIAFINPAGAGTSTLDFNTNGTPDLNFLRKYATTPFQVEAASSGGIDLVVDSNNNETGASVRFLTNGVRDSGTQTLLATFFDNGTNELTNRTTVTIPALGGTTATGYSLVNTTAAAAGAQQVSPALQFEGFGWKTNAVAASQSVRWRQFLNPVEAAVSPTAQLAFQVSVNAAAFSSMLTLSSDFAHSLVGDLSMTGSIGNLAFLTLAATGLVRWNTRSAISSPANGILRLTDSATTDFTRLQFGGTTSSYPAIGRNGTALEILGADGAGPSSLQVYNTKTNATTFERLDIQWAGNVAQIWTEKGSVGGTARELHFGTDGIARLEINAAGTIEWGAVSQLETDGSIFINSGTLFTANVTSGLVSIAGVIQADVGTTSLGFFGALITQQDVVLLTNNIGAGGTADTLDDFSSDSGVASLGTDLMDQATVPDKATLDGILDTIHGDINQLGLKVIQIIQLLEAYGLAAP